MSKSIIILGSSRRKGNTGGLADLIASKINCEVVDITQLRINPYDYEHKNRHDDFFPLIKKIIQYENLIFASPVYWYTMSAQMKIFFDRISDLLSIEKDLGRKLKGKKAFLISTGSDTNAPDCFYETFALSFKYLHMEFAASLFVFEKDFESSRDKIKFFLDRLKAE